MGSDLVDRFARSDSKHEARVLDLKESQASAVGHRFQDGKIGWGEGQRARLSATQGSASLIGPGHYLQLTRSPNLLHDFVPGPLSRCPMPTG